MIYIFRLCISNIAAGSKKGGITIQSCFNIRSGQKYKVYMSANTTVFNNTICLRVVCVNTNVINVVVVVKPV